MPQRKSTRKFKAPLGELEDIIFLFQITSVDVTGSYSTTPRKKRYLVTLIDNFTKYAEAFTIPVQTAKIFAWVCATQIITRHGTGSKLITDQGRAFISWFIRETCKMLGMRKTHTPSYHPQYNGKIESFHRDLHAGLSHYVNSANTNCDILVPFYPISHPSKPHFTTGFSPLFLLCGREMIIYSHENLKDGVTGENPDHKTEKITWKLVLNSIQDSS